MCWEAPNVPRDPNVLEDPNVAEDPNVLQGIHGNYLLDTAQDLSHMKKGQASDLPEIEVTPEMLREGARVLDQWQEFDFSLDEERVARDVYIAMAELATSPRRRAANRNWD